MIAWVVFRYCWHNTSDIIIIYIYIWYNIRVWYVLHPRIYIYCIYIYVVYIWIYCMYIYILYIYCIYIYIVYNYIFILYICIYIYIYIYIIYTSQIEREREICLCWLKIMSISHCPGTPPMRSRKFPWRLCSSCDPAVPRGWEKKTIEWKYSGIKSTIMVNLWLIYG